MCHKRGGHLAPGWKPCVMPLSCMSMVVDKLEAWRTHGLVMAMSQTGLRVVSYT